MLLGPGFRQLEGEFQDAIHSVTGEYRLLCHELARSAFEHAPAHRRIFAFAVLAHDPEVDVSRFAVGQRTFHAGHEAHRTQVHVLVVTAPERDQQPPQRDVIGHLAGQPTAPK